MECMREVFLPRRIFILVAWISAAAGIVVSIAAWLWTMNHQGTRGQRPTAALAIDLTLLAASVLGCVASAVSLMGVRSWREARIIVPGALLGLALNCCNAFFALLSYALEGRNLGG